MALNRSGFKSRKVLRKEARKEKKQRRHEYYTKRGKKNVEKSSKGNKKNDIPVEIKSKKDKFKNLHEQHSFEIKKEKKERKKLNDEIKKKRIERLMEDNLEEEKEIKKLEKQLKFRKGKRSGAFALDGLDYVLDICDKKITSNEGEKAFQESDTEFESDLATVMGKKKSKLAKATQKQKNSNISTDDSDILSDEFNSGSDSETEEMHLSSQKNGKKQVKKSNHEKRSVSNNEDTLLHEKKKKNKKEKHVKFVGVEDNDEYDDEDDDDGDDGDDGDDDDDDAYISEDYDTDINSDIEEEEGFEDIEDNEMEYEEISQEPPRKKQKSKSEYDKGKKIKEVNIMPKDEKLPKKQSKKKLIEKKAVEKEELSDVGSIESELDDGVLGDDKSESDNNIKHKSSKDPGFWEDIYGRTRDKDGNVVTAYKPPQLRNILSSDVGVKNQEKLLRLKRQLKGLLNRLAENNMASISNQIEELYMSNSRNEMNETLQNLFSEAIVTEVLTPERLVAEHAMLIAILHANVGSEVGAYFLQNAVTQFDKTLKEGKIPVEDKRINNLLLFIMHLYNFQIFHSKLMYDLVHEMLKNLEEKQVELILLTLRTVGFSLRKDDPVALKSVVLKIQEKANSLAESDGNYTRMKYMLEVVSAIKNNNVSKIPNYNPELVEHLKKCLKVLIRKGNYKTELNISLQDLLNAEEHGRWWVVGSAWSGSGPNEANTKGTESKNSNESVVSFSQKLLDLAKKQRMNTDVRRTVFCTLMSAEDYLDAFEKLLKLGLKGAVEREILNVLLHCAVQEKDFNPYYFHLANKFCIFDRKYQMMVQYAVWDKIKELGNMVPIQITNLAKFLGNIILNKGLPLSVLKIIQFSEMDKISVKFIRQVLLTILLTDEETVATVFSRIINSPKLKIFRDGIRLFLHHFLLKNIKNNPDENSDHLKKMIEVADRVLTLTDLRSIF